MLTVSSQPMTKPTSRPPKAPSMARQSFLDFSRFPGRRQLLPQAASSQQARLKARSSLIGLYGFSIARQQQAVPDAQRQAGILSDRETDRIGIGCPRRRTVQRGIGQLLVGRVLA